MNAAEQPHTILWFTSDNGPEGKKPGTTGGFKGRKRSLHDGGVRVPGLMTWPAKIKTPRVIEDPVVTSDYLPTVVDALGLTLPEKANQLDGVSMLPLLEGRPFRRPEPIGFVSQHQLAYSDARYKIYRNGRDNPVELYDMEVDPYERTNVADDHPEVVARLEQGFAQWLRSCKDSFEGREIRNRFTETG